MIRRRITPLALLVAVVGSGCSGVLPSLGSGPVVSPSYLAQFRSGGSLSTLWYLGSDTKYHYFSHLVKTDTHYRVRREQIVVPGEFRRGSAKAVYVGNDFGDRPLGIEWPQPE